MIDLERELREMLRDGAAATPTDIQPTPQLLQRARRRRNRNGAGIAAILALLVVVALPAGRSWVAPTRVEFAPADEGREPEVDDVPPRNSTGLRTAGLGMLGPQEEIFAAQPATAQPQLVLGRATLPECDPESCFLGGVRWSPDGQRVAFLHGTMPRVAPWSVSLYVADADGSGLRRLCADDCSAPVWSPDSTAVVYTDPDELLLQRVEHSDERAVLLCDCSATSAAWAPDGSTIAFAGDVDGRGDGKAATHLISPSGKDRRVLTPLSGEPTWSRDGTRIGVDAGTSLHIFTPDGTEMHKTTLPLAVNETPVSWSPDLSMVAYITHRGPGPRGVVWISNADGSDQRRIFTVEDGCCITGTDDRPQWAPEGDMLAISVETHDPDRNGVWILRPDGEVVDRFAATFTSPTWITEPSS